jgi:hypothetical protein
MLATLVSFVSREASLGPARFADDAIARRRKFDELMRFGSRVLGGPGSQLLGNPTASAVALLSVAFACAAAMRAGSPQARRSAAMGAAVGRGWTRGIARVGSTDPALAEELDKFEAFGSVDDVLVVRRR